MNKELYMIKELFDSNKKVTVDYDRYSDYVSGITRAETYNDTEKEIIITENDFTVEYLNNAEKFYITATTTRRYYDNELDVTDDDYYKGCNVTTDFEFAFEDVNSLSDFIKNNVITYIERMSKE